LQEDHEGSETEKGRSVMQIIAAAKPAVMCPSAGGRDGLRIFRHASASVSPSKTQSIAAFRP
jgi:hypothetical protein